MVFIGSCAGTFYAFDTETGQKRWSYDIHKDGDQTSFHGDSLITDDSIIVGTDGKGIGHVYAFERATGKVLWKYSIARGVPGNYGATTDVVRSGANAYVATIGDELICLDIKTGSLKWSFQSGFARDKFSWSRRPAVIDNRIFFGGIDGVLYTLEPSTGSVVWKKDFGSRISTHLTSSGRDLYLGTANGHFYRVNQKTGAVVTDFVLPVTPVGVPIIAGEALLVFLNSKGGDGGAEALACLDLSLTKIRWSQKDTAGWSLTRAYVWRGDVLAGNEAGEVLAFRLNDGTRQWAHQFKGTIRSIGGAGETLYVGTLNGTIYAYSPQKTSESSAGRTQGQDKQSTEIKELRAELERMLVEDQRLRTQTNDVEKKYGHNSKELAALWAEQEAMDKKILRRLEEIIERYGWPGESLVGADASLAAFLILQHADYEYQKKYFPLVKEAERKKEIDPSNVALLEDRILMREGEKQIYGTQLTWNEKSRRYELYAIEDEEHVDLLRARVGLQSIAEYLKTFGLEYIPPRKKQ
jgi:outer membrane protein assembly factor BamB